MRNKIEDDDWMDYPPKPSLIHVIVDLLFSPYIPLAQNCKHGPNLP